MCPFCVCVCIFGIEPLFFPCIIFKNLTLLKWVCYWKGKVETGKEFESIKRKNKFSFASLSTQLL